MELIHAFSGVVPTVSHNSLCDDMTSRAGRVV